MENPNREGGSRNVNKSSDQLEEASSPISLTREKHSHRHTPQQIQRLEGYFKECEHPNKAQRQELSRELGLEIKQIKYWFQNKRTQMKALNEKAEVDALREENERLHQEKLALSDHQALKNGTCSKCQQQKLRLENKELTKKIAEIRNSFANAGANADLGQTQEQVQGNPFANGLEEHDEKMMIETAAKGMEEMLELLEADEPVWMRCPSDPERFTIRRESYDNRFPKSKHLNSSSSRFESSKDSTEVQMNATDLVKLFMHPNDWVDLFPTIVTKGNTLHILDSQLLTGSLHVIYEQMHIFSPLVAPRDFALLRYCSKCDPSSWVILDVSYDFWRQLREAPPTRCWKLPSGCKIQNLPNGNSKVTWVEHVEVDDKATDQAYGAKTWLVNLQRTCERFLLSSGLAHDIQQRYQLEGVINIPEGRTSTMKLANKMVKSFCQMLTVLDEDDFPQSGEMNNIEIRFSIRDANKELGAPADWMIISGATSLWLPLSCSTLFAFFTQSDKRPQWDVLLNGNHVNEIEHISSGSHSKNCISIFRRCVPNENEPMLIFQESGIDASGAFIIYSPIGMPALTTAINGEDTSHISLQPSGITISTSDNTGFHNSSTSSSPQPQHGSLVTVALQVLLRRDETRNIEYYLESLKIISTLIASTVLSTKASLDQ